MDKMNLFSDAGAKSSKDNEKQKTDNISKIELLIACYVESLPEDRQKRILNLANVLHNAVDSTVKQDVKIDTYTLLQNLKDFQNGFNKFLEEEVTTVLKKAGLFESNNSKVINTSEVINVSKAPIQDETGILRFRQVDVVSSSYNMELDSNKIYAVDVKSKKSCKKCIQQLKEDTGLNFAWHREDEGKKHRILYDTKMYYVDEAGYFSYDERNALIPLMPLNGTSCDLLFSYLKITKTIDFRNFYTNNVVDMGAMFSGSREITELNLSSFDTSNVTDMYSMFYCCEKLVKLNLSSFSTENVERMDSMFGECAKLRKLDLSSFSTVSVKYFAGMFAFCEVLNHIDVSHNWILNNDVEDDEIFNGCYKLPHYKDGCTGLEMFRSVNEGGYFHYVGEEDKYE